MGKWVYYLCGGCVILAVGLLVVALVSGPDRPGVKGKKVRPGHASERAVRQKGEGKAGKGLSIQKQLEEAMKNAKPMGGFAQGPDSGLSAEGGASVNTPVYPKGFRLPEAGEYVQDEASMTPEQLKAAGLARKAIQRREALRSGFSEWMEEKAEQERQEKPDGEPGQAAEEAAEPGQDPQDRGEEQHEKRMKERQERDAKRMERTRQDGTPLFPAKVTDETVAEFQSWMRQRRLLGDDDTLSKPEVRRLMRFYENQKAEGGEGQGIANTSGAASP